MLPVSRTGISWRFCKLSRLALTLEGDLPMLSFMVAIEKDDETEVFVGGVVSVYAVTDMLLALP